MGRRGSQHEHELFIAIEGTTASMRLHSFAMGSYLQLLLVRESLVVFRPYGPTIGLTRLKRQNYG